MLMYGLTQPHEDRSVHSSASLSTTYDTRSNIGGEGVALFGIGRYLIYINYPTKKLVAHGSHELDTNLRTTHKGLNVL